jgi:hypothetical protein
LSRVVRHQQAHQDVGINCLSRGEWRARWRR